MAWRKKHGRATYHPPEMTLQFVANTKDGGRLLGLGLSFANLERMEAHDPVVVDLTRHEGRGSLLVAAAEDEVGVAGAKGLLGGPCYVARLDAAALEALRRGQPLQRSLGAPGFVRLLLFTGQDELELIATLRGAGLVEDDAPLHGLDEYFLHEAGLCAGCSSCEARWAGEGGAARTPSGDHYGDAGRFDASSAAPDPHAEQGWRGAGERAGRASSSPTRWPSHPNVAVAVLVGLMVIVAGVIAYAAHYVEAEQEREREARRAADTQAAQEQIASDRRRRAALATKRPAALASRLESTPCPLKVHAPRGMNNLMLMKTRYLERVGQTRFDRQMRYWLIRAGLDVLPAAGRGVGPLRRRLHRDASLEARRRPVDPPIHRSFVVMDWRDPELPKDIDEFTRKAPQGARRTFRAGLVRGRMLVWSYAEDRFVCASPVVVALSPNMTLKRMSDFIRPGKRIIDDALNKTRAETLIAAMRKASKQLRAVAR